MSENIDDNDQLKERKKSLERALQALEHDSSTLYAGKALNCLRNTNLYDDLMVKDLTKLNFISELDRYDELKSKQAGFMELTHFIGHGVTNLGPYLSNAVSFSQENDFYKIADRIRNEILHFSALYMDIAHDKAGSEIYEYLGEHDKAVAARQFKEQIESLEDKQKAKEIVIQRYHSELFPKLDHFIEILRSEIADFGESKEQILNRVKGRILAELNN